MPLAVEDHLPEGSPKGYIEFYCSGCLSSLTILRLQDGKEVHMANLATGATVGGASHSPDRMKRVRIAQEPGEFEYVIKLLSPALTRAVQGSLSTTIRIHVKQDMLIPIKVTFQGQSFATFKWDLHPGDPLPLKVGPNNLNALVSALSDPDWGTRWYAIEVLGQPGAEIDNAALTRLTELAGKDAYHECTKTEGVTECSLVREQATRVLTAVKKRNP
jgi:hypothetical protein